MSSSEDNPVVTVVAIASNNYLLRLGLQRIVEVETWIRLIGHAANASALEENLVRERPHIMIVDTEIASDVTEFIRKVRAASPRIRIVLLSGLQDSESTRRAIDCGVDGIVLKVQPSAVLIATIQHLAPASEQTPGPLGEPGRPSNGNGKPSGSATPMEHPIPGAIRWPQGLTEREREVIQLISLGLSNKDIADRLCISSITVRHHLTNIFDKLGVSNRQKLLIRAHQYGIVELTARA